MGLRKLPRARATMKACPRSTFLLVSMERHGKLRGAGRFSSQRQEDKASGPCRELAYPESSTCWPALGFA